LKIFNNKKKVGATQNPTDPTEELNKNSYLNEEGNSSGNISNGNLLAGQGDWIYYCFDGSIYKQKNDGSHKTKIYDPFDLMMVELKEPSDLMMVELKEPSYLNIDEINVIGEWIYYLTSRGTSRGIYKILTDGSNRVQLLEGENSEEFYDFCVFGEWIYYKDQVYIFRISTEGKNRAIIGSNNFASHFNIVDGWLYYQKITSIEKIPVDGSSFPTEVINFRAEEVPIIDGFIAVEDFAYLTKTDGLYKVRLADGSLIKLSNDICTKINYKDGYIYYADVKRFWNLYKISTEGGEKIKLSDKHVNCIYIVEDYIYFMEYSSYKLYRINTDGTNLLEFD
jgi:hypothetical protein